jgi:hypothetical protein
VSSTWTSAELDTVAASEELQITGERADGTLYRWTPIWVVRVDQDHQAAGPTVSGTDTPPRVWHTSA